MFLCPSASMPASVQHQASCLGRIVKALEGIKSAAQREKHSSRKKHVLINPKHALKGQKAPGPSPLWSVCQTGDFLPVFKFTLKFQH